MKKLFTLFFILFSFSIFGQNKIEKYQLFKPLPESQVTKIKNKNKLSGLFVNIDKEVLKKIYDTEPEEFDFDLPRPNGKTKTYHFVKYKVVTPTFKITTSDGKEFRGSKENIGVSYRVYDASNSRNFGGITVTKDEIIGVLQDETNSNSINISKLNSSPSTYSLLPDNEIKEKPIFNCETPQPDPNIPYSEWLKKIQPEKKDIKIPTPEKAVGGSGCQNIGIYIECDYRMYQDNGSSTSNTSSKTTALFNLVKQLFDNEGISVSIDQIYVWTTVDPYATLSPSGNVLSAFVNNRQAITQKIGHLLSTRPAGLGGIAYVDIVCIPFYYPYRFGFSNIYNTFTSDVNTYSWSVYCMTHELGHNFGSNHTHNCGWLLPNNTYGRIDSCYTGEPYNGVQCGTNVKHIKGTIMSYCHLGPAGIDLMKGFGPLPGAKIRSGLSCLSGTSIPFVKINTQRKFYTTGDNLVLSTQSLSNATYRWTGPNGYSSTLQNPIINSLTTTNAGLYSLEVVQNACTSNVAKFRVRVNPTLNIPQTETFSTWTSTNNYPNWELVGPYASSELNNTYNGINAQSFWGSSKVNLATTHTSLYHRDGQFTSVFKDTAFSPIYTNSNYKNIYASFKLAHALKSSSASQYDSLEVLAYFSGKTKPVSIYKKGGLTLRTITTNTTTSYVPSTNTSTDWRTETIDLTSYDTCSKVQFAFVHKPTQLNTYPSNNLFINSLIVGGNPPATSLKTATLSVDNSTTFNGSYTLTTSIPSTHNATSYEILQGTNIIASGSLSDNNSSVITTPRTNISTGTYTHTAKLKNSTETTTSNSVTVVVNPVSPPVVVTSAITNIGTNSATLGGNVTSSGGGVITRRGVCYSTTTNPDTTKTVINIGSGIGTYSQNVPSLVQGVTYYVKAFAINSAGISYGTQVSFVTLSPPTISTTSATNVTQNSFQSGGNITSEGGSSVTSRGVCFSTTADPTINSPTVLSGTGPGIFSVNVTGLSQGVTYYYRSFATNSFGTAYGTQFSVKTLGIPTVSTSQPGSITSTSAVVGGNVSSTGGGTLSITSRGICYSTTPGPTLSNTVINSSTLGTGTFTLNMTNLSPSTTYYVKAFATNSLGTAFGNEVSFITPSVPVLTTSTITSITTNGAITGGSISSSAGSSVTARGVCYSTSPGPTISLTTKTSDGVGTGTFTSTLTNLSPSTTYYVRAYATNTSGTGYGNELTFTTTTSGSTPTLSTNPITNIGQTTATCGGNVTQDGGFAVTLRGVCYSTTPGPTINNNIVQSGGGLGQYNSNLTNLTPNTTYYVRAFATNSNGTNYGNEVTFTTLSVNTKPLVSTLSVISITNISAIAYGEVTSTGGLSVTNRGVCYSTSPNPTIGNNVVQSGSGQGTFTSSISNLTPGTLYYLKSFATNSLGTSYGQELSFTTLNLPSVSTSTPSSITSNSAICGGNVTSSGGSTVTSRGVVWSTSTTPDISLVTKTVDGSGLGTYTSNITGLFASTTYYVRSYATNTVGTIYGNEISFTTIGGGTLPSLTTNSVTSISATSAVTGGNITSSGSQSVTNRGVVWSTSTLPTIALQTKTSNGLGTGSFSATISPLIPSTNYYVRAYATSAIGTEYGNQLQFTTTSSGSNSCSVNTFNAYKLNGFWRFKWNLNSNCTSYTVTVSRYNNTDPNIPPPTGATPSATGFRLKNYVPTVTEINQGFIDQQMKPQPQKTGYWYSFDVRCNASSCSGSNTTRSNYFYTQ